MQAEKDFQKRFAIYKNMTKIGAYLHPYTS
jgi:hypothetical protein